MTTVDLDRLRSLAKYMTRLRVEGSTLVEKACEEIEELINDKNIWKQNCKKLLKIVESQAKTLLRQKEEIERLKRGDFTEEEFQNLCHNSSLEDQERFRKGCEEYQKKLFGCSGVNE